MWVSTSFSSALNFLPHQVCSAFQLSIRPPSSRMKRKFPCSAQGGTSPGLARYLGAGSKDWAEQSSREAATKPISRMFLTIRTRCRVPSLRNHQDHHGGYVIGRDMRRLGSTNLRFQFCMATGLGASREADWEPCPQTSAALAHCRMPTTIPHK